MKNLTTPQAILCGLGLIALAILISGYVPNSVIKEAKADSDYLSIINDTLIKNNNNIVEAINNIEGCK